MRLMASFEIIRGVIVGAESFACAKRHHGSNKSIAASEHGAKSVKNGRTSQILKTSPRMVDS